MKPKRPTKCGQEFALVIQTVERTASPDHLPYKEHTPYGRWRSGQTFVDKLLWTNRSTDKTM